MHRALLMEKKVPCRIIAIDRNGPEMFIAATVQVNFFTDLTPALRAVVGGIRSQVKVVECIMEASGLLPYP